MSSASKERKIKIELMGPMIQGTYQRLFLCWSSLVLREADTTRKSWKEVVNAANATLAKHVAAAGSSYEVRAMCSAIVEDIKDESSLFVTNVGRKRAALNGFLYDMQERLDVMYGLAPSAPDSSARVAPRETRLAQ